MSARTGNIPPAGQALCAQNFLGRWQICRQIADARAGTTVEFTGTAHIFADGADWTYRENGQLRVEGGSAFQAERKYLWRPGIEGIDIYFEDGRFFHRFSLKGVPEAAHWCDPDQYDVRYDLARWPVWQSTWQVRGPRKDYKMVSLYRPMAESGS